MTTDDTPRLTMLDDIRADLAESVESPGVVKAAKLIGERFCIPEEQVRPYILAVLLQLTVASDCEFLDNPTSQLRRLDNMGYNIARAAVAAESIGWSFSDLSPQLTKVFGDYASVTDWAAQVTKAPIVADTVQDSELEQ